MILTGRMVVDDREDGAIKTLAMHPPIGATIVAATQVMAESNGHLDLEPVEFAFESASQRVVGPVELLDHAPIRERGREIYFRFRRTVCKMPPLLM